jgi:hypothetical protein
LLQGKKGKTPLLESDFSEINFIVHEPYRPGPLFILMLDGMQRIIKILKNLVGKLNKRL